MMAKVFRRATRLAKRETTVEAISLF